MSASTGGWMEMGRRSGRVFAFVRPAFRTYFPAEWFSAGRYRFSQTEAEDPFIRHRLLSWCETMIGFTAADLRQMDGRTLLVRIQRAQESGHLLIIAAPQDEWQRRTSALLTEQRSVSGTSTTSTTAAKPAPASPATSAAPAPKPTVLAPLAQAPQTTWIDIRLVGEDDQSLKREPYRLILSDGRDIREPSEESGRVFRQHIDPGACRFSLPNLDHAAWSTISGGGAEAVTIVVGSERDHLVAEGQSTSSIASGYGFAPDTVWNDPDNSGLRQKRTHPNLLLPGDELAIPALKRKEITLATTQIHTFKRLGTRTLVVMQVLDGDAPRANQPWKLAIGDQTSKGTEGTSDGDGVVELWVAPSERSGTLTIGKDEFKLLLDFDHLHPLNEPSGVRQRLANLGFWVELPDQTPDECLTAAVRSFQVRVELDPTGKINDQTRQKLTDVHDRRCPFPAEPAITHKA